MKDGVNPPWRRSVGPMVLACQGMWVVMVMSVVVTSAAKEEAQQSLQKPLTIEYNATNLFPESFDWDAKHGHFLVGSAALAKLVSVSEQGTVAEFVTDDEYPTGTGVLGVTVDLKGNRVLAVLHSFDKEKPFTGLVAYDLDSKKRLLFVRFDDVGGSHAVANDVTVDAEGNAYVTNARGNLIWKVSSSGQKSDLVSLPQQPVVDGHELQKVCDANGIVHQNGHLIVAQTNSGNLFRVTLADKEVRPVQIADGSLLPGADGIVMRPDGSLVVVSLSKAWLLTTRDSWISARVIDSLDLDASVSITSVAVKGSRVFILHSHILGLYAGEKRDIFKIQEIEFRSDSQNDLIWLIAILAFFLISVLAWKFQMSQFNKSYTKKRA